MLAIAGSSTSTSSLTASLFASTGSAGTASAGAASSGGSTAAAVEISVTRSSATSVAIAAPTPRDALAGGLKSLDASLDRLLAKGTGAKGTGGKDEAGEAAGDDKLDRLQFLLDSLQMILKDRAMSSSDKIAMVGYLSNVATGKAPSEGAKAAFGAVMSGVAERANLPPDRAADYRGLLGTFAKVPEGFGASAGPSAFVSRVESLSVSIKGAFETITDAGTRSSEFEFTQEMVAGFAAALGEGETQVAALSASRSSLSYSLSASAAYRAGDGATPLLDQPA